MAPKSILSVYLATLRQILQRADRKVGYTFDGYSDCRVGTFSANPLAEFFSPDNSEVFYYFESFVTNRTPFYPFAKPFGIGVVQCLLEFAPLKETRKVLKTMRFRRCLSLKFGLKSAF